MNLAAAATAERIGRRQGGDPPPLSFAQQRLWFLDRLEPASPFYNVATGARFPGRLDRRALERSLQEIVRRHEALRTTFELRGGEPVQVIAPDVELALELIDLHEVEAEAREARLAQVTAQEISKPFDLARGPLVRARLVRLSDEDHVLLVTMHHIVSDGWSTGLLLRELSAL